MRTNLGEKVGKLDLSFPCHAWLGTICVHGSMWDRNGPGERVPCLVTAGPWPRPATPPLLARVENVTNGQTDKRTNGQTHIGGWAENVTNRRTDKRT